MPFRGLAVALPVAAILVSSSTHAQQCTPGPECSAANSQAEARIAGWQRVFTGNSAHLTAIVTYCVHSEVVKVAEACRAEFQRAGNRSCASLAAQQKNESTQAADSARRTAMATASSGSWNGNCPRP